MIDHDAIPLKVKIPSQNHGSGIQSGDRRSAGHAVIQTLVIALYFSVEDSFSAEHIGDWGSHWRSKVAGPLAFRCHPVEECLFGLLVLRNGSQLISAGLGKFLRHTH